MGIEINRLQKGLNIFWGVPKGAKPVVISPPLLHQLLLPHQSIREGGVSSTGRGWASTPS